MADSNIQTLDTVKPITLDEYQERTAHLQENTTSLLSTIADKRVQAAGLATQAASLASEVNAVAEQASLSFSKKTWTDNATSGTPITAAELNRLENAISSLTTAVNNLQDSVSPKVLWDGSKANGNFVLSDSLSNWLLIGVYVSINSANDNEKTLLVPCSIPNLSASSYGLNGMSSAMSATDVRDIRVSLRYVDDKTLAYNSVIKTTLYTVNSGVQSTVTNLNVNGIVGLIQQ